MEIPINLTLDTKPLTQQEKARTDTLRINEIFYSIQGEGSRAGDRCIFIRLTGCGLRCSYCDTEYAFFEGEDAPISQLLNEIAAFDCKLVELTGGEPLEQEGVYALMQSLLEAGYEVMIETGGHIDISRVDGRVKRIVDLKTPSSLMMKRNRMENIPLLMQRDEVKFVIGSKEDFNWAASMVDLYGLNERAGLVIFSAVHGELTPQQLAKWILDEHLPVRMQVQLHKVIWPAATRGV